MISRDIKNVKYQSSNGAILPVKKIIYDSQLIYPFPKISGITIKGLFEPFKKTDGWKKGILMSSQGIVKTLNNENFSGLFLPYNQVTSISDVLAIEYNYVGGNTMTWKWPNGTYNRMDIWPDDYYDGHFKIEGAEEWYGLGTYFFDTGVSIRNEVGTIENLNTDQGKYHVVGLYEIELN